MRSTIRKSSTMLTAILGSLILMTLTGGSVSSAIKVLPNPVLMITGTEYFEAGGKRFTRYKFSVENRAEYPDELFDPAPTLPPCGANTNSSRTWVDFYDSRGNRLYGFCALKKNADLENIYFYLERDVLPPSFVYIELTDRKTNTKYKSNLAETTQ
jgi:hypothetical protein